jgi:hypothetical protein
MHNTSRKPDADDGPTVGHSHEPGYFFDAKMGLYLPRTGRQATTLIRSDLTSRIRTPIDANLYCYADNRPLIMVDPSGLFRIDNSTKASIDKRKGARQNKMHIMLYAECRNFAILWQCRMQQ